MKNCLYNQICKYQSNDCINEDYQRTCWVFTTLEGILNKEVFKTKIQKRIYRREHRHKQQEE